MTYGCIWVWRTAPKASKLRSRRLMLQRRSTIPPRLVVSAPIVVVPPLMPQCTWRLLTWRWRLVRCCRQHPSEVAPGSPCFENTRNLSTCARAFTSCGRATRAFIFATSSTTAAFGRFTPFASPEHLLIHPDRKAKSPRGAACRPCYSSTSQTPPSLHFKRPRRLFATWLLPC